MTERQARFVNYLMSFLEASKVNLGQRRAPKRREFIREVGARLDRFFDGDVHRTSKRAEPDAEPEAKPGTDSRIHRVTPRMPSTRPGGVVEMTQGESMRIDARAGNAPEMSDG